MSSIPERPPGTRLGLVARLVIAYAIAGMIAGSAAVLLVQASTRNAVRSQIEERLVRTAEAEVRRVDDRIQTRLDKLRLLAVQREVAVLSPGVEAELDIAIAELDAFDELVLYDDRGRPLAASATDRLLIADSLPTRADLAERVTEGEHSFDVHDDGRLEMSVPVEHPAGTVVGVLAGLGPIEEVAIHLVTSTDRETVRYLMDTSGQVLVHPDRSLVVEQAVVDDLDLPPFGGEPVAQTLEVDGEGALVAFAHADLLDVVVGVEEAESTAFAPVDRALVELVLMAALIVLAAIVTMALVGERLLRPIGELAQAAARFGRGEERVRVPEGGAREVAMLSGEFNRMAESLERRMEELRQHRRTEAELRQEADLIKTMHDIGTTLSAELDVDRLIQAVTDAATFLSGAEFGAFFYNVVDEDGEAYMLYSLSGARREDFDRFPMPRNTEIFAPTFAGERIVRLDDVKKDPRYGKNAPHFGMPEGHLPVRSYLAVPVVSRTGEVHGGLFFGHQDVGVFGEREERLVASIAGQAAIALDNARLYEAERTTRRAAERAQERLTVIAEAGRLLGSSIDLQETVENVARLCVPLVADACCVDLLAEDGSIVRAAAAAQQRFSDVAERIKAFPPDPTDDAHPVVRVIRSGEARLLDMSATTLRKASIAEEHRELAMRFAGNSGVCVPIPTRDGPIGAISLVTLSSEGRVFGNEDLQLVEEIARRAALAIEHAKLFAQQRSVAETLQRSLLPEHVPAVPGVQTAVRYLPGGPGVDVGGDWFDVFELSGGLIGVAMGDVVGRGLRAATVMGQLRNALRAYALEGHAPAELMHQMNQLLQEAEPDRFATLVYAVFDQESGMLELCNAGHPPPLVLRSGRCSFLSEGSNAPLGAMASTAFVEETTPLRPGDTLLLYTDGLIERSGSSLDDGFEALRDAVEAAPDGAEALCDHVLERLLGLGETDDDVAMLALQLTALGPRLELSLPARPSVLAPLRSTLRRWLAAAGADDDVTFEIVAAVGEACMNAIEHGSASLNARFDLEAVQDGDVVIRVRDRGRWRKPRESLRGRGLEIIRSFMDDFDIDATPRGTTITMRRALDGRRQVGS